MTSAIEGCQASHRRLLDTIATVTDGDVGRPSRLPGWTAGHVLAHLARNADSHVRMLDAAARGEVTDQYAGGNQQRAADIEAGAARPARQQIDDVRRTIDQLEATWDRTPADVWATGKGRMAGSGEVPIADLPLLRWREVELHHADLGLSFGWGDWSDAYVSVDLGVQLAGLPERLDPAERRRLLAWLVGRLDGNGDAGRLPAIAPWQREQRERRPTHRDP